MRHVIRLSKELKEQVIDAMMKVADKEMTESELSKVFFDTVQAQVVPEEKRVGYERWSSVRNWLVPDFRARAIKTPAIQQEHAMEKDELRKAVEEIIKERIDKLAKQTVDAIQGLANEMDHRSDNRDKAIDAIGKIVQDSNGKIAVMASVTNDLVKALKDVFVTLELQKHTLSVEVNKEIERIAKDVMPTIELVEDASDLRFSVVIIGLIANQENVIKEKFGKRLKLSFVTSQQASRNKGLTMKYRNANAILGMSGFMSHSGSFNQFKHKFKAVSGGMTSLINELEALCKIVKSVE